MPQVARDGGVAMYRMYGMPQVARDGGVAMSRDERYIARSHGRRCPWVNRMAQVVRNEG